MAFKKAPPPTPIPESPEQLFLDLPRRKIPAVLPHQREVMQTYVSEALNVSDVALQLPTGSGKTLVGLLIAEWRRRRNQERIVYLCPTRQLVNQVVEQANEKYGLKVLGFTGSANDYDPDAKTGYRGADRIAVTTYSSLFNTSPYFHDADVLILDDAHAAEGYVASLWSVRIERNDPDHETLHAAMRNVLKPHLTPINFTRLSGEWDSPADRDWVDKLPTPVFAELQDQVVEVLDAHVDDTRLKYSWSMIREYLHACQIYLSSNDILVRPLIPPTWTLAAFRDPKQRIYMSATLGAGGDLERLMGQSPIRRIRIPVGWHRQGVGRRFFMFPGMALDEANATQLRCELMRLSGRSLVLVPNDRKREKIAEDVKRQLGFATFDARAIEESKKPFISTANAVAIIANRYDGIDFPGDECRLLFIEGLPKGMNLQERFLMTRMGANALLNERVQTRVLQAIGRCTRSLEDYSAVVVSGEELQDYLADIRRRKFFHPELQAEIGFGVNQSQGITLRDMVENFQVFLENGKDWEDISQQIVAARKLAVQEAFPVMDQLSEIVAAEIEFQTRLWQSDYVGALDCAKRVLGSLTRPELRGYRALWHYLAGSAAWLAERTGVAGSLAQARTQFGKAKDAAIGIPWLVSLAQFQAESPTATANNSVLMGQIERVETVLAQLGTVHDRKYASREKEILEGLALPKRFEQAQKLLGELVGFDAGKEEATGSPDPWWIAGNLCLVFEDHAEAQHGSALDVTKARQAASHPKWMRANIGACAGCEILSVLVTPVTKVSEGAIPHLADVALWKIDDFRAWGRNALAVVRKLRTTFVEPGDLEWRSAAAEAFQQNELDAPALVLKLRAQPAAKLLKSSK